MHSIGLRTLGLTGLLAGVFVLFARQAVSATGAPTRDSAWAYTPPGQIAIPDVKNRDRVRNPIDAFILAKLEARGLTLSLSANKATLLRRVTFDLTGLPPTIAELEAFGVDSSPEAFAKVVDRLLASRQYGERWAQHWLDLVRYAETDGFKADDFRPNAYRYRDYVIRALNGDMPYDRFIRQQIAGDELEPGNPDALIATGLNRLYPDEYNAANLEQRRQEILDDITEVTGSVFLGLTIGCARCHDHKFDPIPQADFYRLQAFFAPMLPRDDLLAVDRERRAAFQTQRIAWEKETQPYRDELDHLTAAKRAQSRAYALGKFRKEIQDAVKTPVSERTPYQVQIAAMAEKQLHRAETDALKKLPAEMRNRCQALERTIEQAEPAQVSTAPVAMGITDLGKVAPPTNILSGGDWRKPKKAVKAGFPVALGRATPDTRIDPSLASTGRRAALARWLTKPDNSLTARVIVNRVWQHHFGVGIVATPNDFGAQGEPPTHPELLDWLARDFIEHGWSLKRLHRLILTSATYQQSSLVDPANAAHARGMQVDRANKLLWHAHRQRLEGEALRDAMLALSGDLNARPFGPSAHPRLPAGISSYAWKPDADPLDQNRRSIYVLAKRNMRYPLFDAFDLPDMHNSCGRRSKTITAPQALLFLNSDFTLEQARHWASRLRRQFPDDPKRLVAHAMHAAWGRDAQKDEVERAARFLLEQSARIGARGDTESASDAALTDLVHALLNANEFIFVD